MSISVDTVNLRFNVKPDYDQQQLQQLQEDLKQGQKELEKTRKAMDKLAKNGLKAMTKEQREEYDKLSSTLSKQARTLHENEKKMQSWTRSTDISKLSLQQLGQRAKDLTAVLNNLKPTTDEFREYKDELDAVKERMKELKTVAKDTEDSLGKFSDGFFKTVSKGVVALNAALQIKDRIVNWAQQYVDAFAKMDDAMTDVMKYTGQTKREVEEMNETFKQMTTRTPREELNALAGAAGRLGIQGRKDIEGFVDAADKINVALGDDLGEGAIDQIGKLTMVFGEDKTKGLNGAMLATGSAINVLGANSSANTGFITEFTSSMAGMAVNANISQTDIMGYASALSQAGIEGQTASGVFAQLITKMFTDPARFAKAARLDVKAFTDLLKTDANAAILQFLEGLKQNGGFDALAPALKSLKMQGTQAVPVISSLINKMDELKKAQQTAKQAYDEGTSIIDEFNNANSSAAAKLEIEKKKLNDVSVELGRNLMPIIQTSISTTTSSLRVIFSIAGVLVDNAKAFVQLTIAVSAYTVAVNAAAIKTAVLKTVTTLATEAQVALNAAMAKSPYGLAAAAIAMLGSEILNYINRAIEATDVQEDLNTAMTEAKKEATSERLAFDRLIETVKSATASENERKEALDELNGKLMSLHLGNLTEEKIRTGDLTAVLDAYNRKLETSIKLKRLQAQQEDLINKKIDLEEGGYKDDISFIDRGFQTIAAAGQAMISGHIEGFRTAWNNEWNRVEDSYKNRALRPILEGLDSVEEKMSKIRADEEKEANTIHNLGELVVTPDHHKGDGGSGGGSGAGNSGKNDKQQKEEEKAAKLRYEREKLLLKQYYQGRKDLADEWHQKEFQAEQRYLGELGNIRQKHNASESEMMEVQNQMIDSVTKEANYREELRKRKHQEYMKQIDMEQSTEEIGLAQKRLNGEIATEEEYSRQKLDVERRYQQKRCDALQKGSEEYQAAQKRLLSLELQQAQQRKKDEEQYTSSYQNTNNSILQQHFSEADSFADKLALLEQYHDQALISEEQYQQNLTRLQEEHTNQRQQIQQAAQQAVGELLSSATQLFSAMQQRETAAVEKKYKKQIDAAKKRGKDTTKLEEQMEAEKAAIQKKYAKKQFQLNVLQIVASTATGIARLWKDLPFYAALPLTAVVAASGAAQLAAAKMASDQADGLYRGGYSDDYQEGYTDKGNPREQAGVIPVHKNEFVANHKAVANPEVKPVLDVIDRHQKAGDIQMLNSTRMLEEAYGRGRYRGGFSRGGGNIEDPDDENTPDTVGSNREVLVILRRIADNTEDALTVRELRKEIRHQESLEARAGR